MRLNTEEETRYSRQLLINGYSERRQEKLKESTAMVAGIGGLGGNAALYLAAAGIGRLILVHPGELELPDMNRQILMYSKCVGEERTNIAQRRLKEINPFTEVITISEWITEDNADGIVSKADIILDCRHNFKERYLLNKTCVRYKKPMIEGAMDDMFGYITTIMPGETPCLSCLFPEYPEWDYLGFAVLGTVSGTLGTLMALEAIKVITGLGNPLYSELLTFDGLTMDFKKLKLQRDSNCSVCGN